MSTQIILIVFGIILLVVMIYSYMRDSENSRQIRFLANTMDNFNKQLFSLERQIQKMQTEFKGRDASVDVGELKQSLQQDISSMAEPISFSLDEIQNSFSHFKKQMEIRIEHIEDGIKSITMPKSITGLDDQKIISLYKQGMDVDAIAKELLLSKGEVEFALKISKMQ